MKTLILHRNYFAHGTFSILTDEHGNSWLKTVEREWHNNQPGISCIPEGEYRLVPHCSPRYGNCYAVVSDPLGVTIHGPSLRTHILIHAANLPEQLEGCIAPGLRFGSYKGKWAVLESKLAVEQLIKHLGGKQARLIIRKA